MNTKHYTQKKIIRTLFGENSYSKIKALKILLDYLVGKDYEQIYSHLSKMISNDAVVIDVGANMGQYLSRLSKIIKQGKIISIDPLPENIDALEKMQSLLRIKNSIIVHKAISDKVGIEKLAIPILNDVVIGTQARLYEKVVTKENNVKFRFIDVLTTTLDNIYEEYNLKRVDFIKVDTEGADYIVLQSGKNLIKEFKPLIRIEQSCFSQELPWLFELNYIPFFIKNDTIVIAKVNMKDNFGNLYLSTADSLQNISKYFHSKV